MTPAPAASSWHGHPCWSLASDELSVQVVPGRGGKVTSIRQPDGFEWLSQATGSRVPASSPSGQGFTDAEMCGWDECAPTIDPCTTADGWHYADHGNLWDRPWQVDEARDDLLTTSVLADPVPLALSRSLQLVPGGMDVRYRASSTAEHQMPLLWAWHPQFAARPGSRLEVDSPTMVDALAGGAEQPWPGHAELPVPGDCRKLWTPRESHTNQARLVHPDGRTLTASWTGEAVRWVGLWLDAGAYGPSDVMAIEPSTGWYDDAARAEQAGTVAVLPPGGQLEWTLQLRFTSC